MYPLSVKKTLVGTLAAIVILMPEDSFDIFLTALDYTFESFELFLEQSIQYFFHVEKQDSQIFSFYILLAIGAGLSVWLFYKLPSILKKLISLISLYYLGQKKTIFTFWITKSFLQKMLIITVYIPVLLYIGSFLIM